MSQTSTPPPPSTDRKPKVAIVGAGIAGVTLAILLHKQGVPFEVYERAREVKPLGSAISLGANVTPLLKQLGIYEEFVGMSKAYSGIQVYNDQREYDYTMDFTAGMEMAGGKGYIVSRPLFYALLLRQLPKERLNFNSKLLSVSQTETGVTLTTSDHQIHHVDILVGADGAYSVVRQGLYEDLKAKGTLPEPDHEPLPFTNVCLVGQTIPLDPELFPQLKMEETQFLAILGEGSPFSLSTFTTKQNTICWGMVQHLDEASSKSDDTFLNSEWGPEAAEQMCKQVYDFAVPGAAEGAKPLVLGDLMDLTPKDLISKVMLEEKVFQTWYGGRTVLIGDACHKVNPAGGAGAVNAIHDAIALANWISVLPSTQLEHIEDIFEQYRKERLPIATEAFETSKMFKQIGGKGFSSKVMRFFTKHMPAWVWKYVMFKMYAYRPQVSFLPQVQDLASIKPAYQASLHLTLQHAQERGTLSLTPAI